MTLWQEPNKVNYDLAKFGSHKHYGCKDDFHLSCDLTRPRDQRIMCLWTRAHQSRLPSSEVWLL